MENRFEKNVILYATGKTAIQSYEYIKNRWNIVGCSDSNPAMREGKIAQIVPFYAPEQLSELEYDYILITSVYEQEICKYLTTELGLSQEKILLRTEWTHISFLATYGEKNSDKFFYLITKPIDSRIGIYAILFAILEQLQYVKEQGFIPVVDLKNFPNQYLDDAKVGQENAWEHFFEPLSCYSLEEVYQSKNVILGYDSPLYKYGYEEKFDIPCFKTLYQEFIHLNFHVQARVEEDAARILGKSDEKEDKILGILYRGTDMNSLKLPHHPIQPTVEEICDVALQQLAITGWTKVYVSTEDAAALAEICRRLDGYEICYTEQQRFGDTGTKWLSQIDFGRENEKYLRGLEYITTIELLARCDGLVSGVNTAEICALIINNGGYEFTEILDRGEY